VSAHRRLASAAGRAVRRAGPGGGARGGRALTMSAPCAFMSSPCVWCSHFLVAAMARSASSLARASACAAPAPACSTACGAVQPPWQGPRLSPRSSNSPGRERAHCQVVRCADGRQACRELQAQPRRLLLQAGQLLAALLLLAPRARAGARLARQLPDLRTVSPRGREQPAGRRCAAAARGQGAPGCRGSLCGSRKRC